MHLSKIDIKELSEDDFTALLNATEFDVAQIKAQIVADKENRNAGLPANPPEWLAKAQKALVFKQHDHQRLLREMSRRNSEKKNERVKESARKTKSNAELFVNAAKAMLTGDQYAAIWARANCEVSK